MTAVVAPPTLRPVTGPEAHAPPSTSSTFCHGVAKPSTVLPTASIVAVRVASAATPVFQMSSAVPGVGVLSAAASRLKRLQLRVVRPAG